MSLIPLVRPSFPSKDQIWDHFQTSLNSGQISNFGPCHDALIDRLEYLTGRNPVVSVNGTTAIQIAVQAHFARGSKIILPDYTHIGTLQAVVAAGCKPILAPVSPITWTLDMDFLREGLIIYDGAIVVSPFGYPVDFEAYDEIGRTCGKPLIYDLAGAWGMNAKATENTVCFSMHATKNLSCGEGGITLFKRKGIARDARRLTNFDTLPDRSIASPYGANLKPDELKCAVALAQLASARPRVSATRRKQILDHYCRELRAESPGWGNSNASLCVIQSQRVDAQRVEDQCHNHGFVAKRYYPLLSKMPGLSMVHCMAQSPAVMENCLALPSDCTDEEADQVVTAIRRIMDR